MHALYGLEAMLCEELEKIAGKGELTAGSLDTVDKLSHALKNVQKVIEKYEEDEGGYSGAMSGARGGSGANSYYDGMSYGDMSYARGRRNARRDSRGRYSGRGYSMADGRNEMMEEMRGLMKDLPNGQARSRMEQLIREIEMA